MTGAVFSELLTHTLPGFELIAVDLPGHGNSDAALQPQLDSWAEDVEELMAILGLTHPGLVGWSLGGMLALKLIQRRQLEFSALILLSSTPRFVCGDGWSAGLPAIQLRAMLRDLTRDFRRTLEQFYQLMFVTGEVDPARYRQIARFAVGPDRLPTPAVAAAGLEILAREDLRELLGAVELPTLVIHGDDDVIIPVAAGEALRSEIVGARLLRIPETGHAPFLTRPDVVLDAMREFLS
jgi:pimeloyl-[acyl-carrier protein] methyl ester esterase